MTSSRDITRRTLVKGLATSTLIPLLGGNLMACSDGSDNLSASVLANFNHGVASGDPLSDRVIIWTRLTPEAEGQVRVAWEIAMDPQFSSIVTSGSGQTSADVDYTVKVDVEGLQPAATYYYRFMTGDRVSATGKTRTLPEGAVEAASFAVISCSNYPAGFFNVYKEVAQQEVDAVLHLGDYLYEYNSTGYASDSAEEYGRVVAPTNELITLSDYRTRYAQYHGDMDLQAAHAAHPFVIVWDDHEVANDSWMDGADNHDPATEGDWADRKMAAIQAWYEWLPVRPPASADEIIYRRFQYGDLLDLLMLDTRLVGRDQQFTYPDFATDGMIDVEQARAAYGDTNRTLLGSEQLQWLREQLNQSTSRWQVLGQQVLMGRYLLPAAIIEALDPSLAGEDSLAKGTAAIFAALGAKDKAPEDRSEAEQALLDSAVPYNLDAWDGYAYERDELLAYAAQLNSKLVVLAGDTHNAWTTQLTTAEGAVAGVEFGATSVSSPGLDGVLGADTAALLADLVPRLIDDLKYDNLVSRGYLHVRFTANEVVAKHLFVTNIDSTEYTIDAAQTKEFTVQRDDMLVSLPESPSPIPLNGVGG